ncbi:MULTISPECIES: carboxymuconolactone decarboxylase family protein [Flavobacterium]|uniref:Carboxymuconolactone decarboxylase family protein n=1 Tax=Flavobacterium algoritolerans TaxID=3041254 RepID=A0ABT6VC50_9FLAO|nr:MULTISPECIES: carboxymuconolactone decarboxylase family protein [Flavobacterium]MDI5888314.1 carboxymuconolactone decarboxylase family protein [Flavobacterium yafengii]MDI5894754.1 carboxymuconolactone decarboxylase family protein [Flavobacterium algoritolerans]
MKQFRIFSFKVIVLSFALFSHYTKAQDIESTNKKLSAKEKSIITIASLTAKGDLATLKLELNKGLEAGLTVNEIKEILIHTYAYCGFPRSIRGLQTFMEVLNERKTKGINDESGKEASPIKEDGNKYQRGKTILEQLTKTPQPNTLTGYSAFAPVIDTFLKEHLFTDIFERDILTYTQRELVTISVISAIGDAEPMLKSHLTISLNVGISPEQLKEFIGVIQPIIGRKKTKEAKEVVSEVLKSRQKNN